MNLILRCCGLLAVTILFNLNTVAANGFAKTIFEHWKSSTAQIIEQAIPGAADLLFPNSLLFVSAEICNNGIDDDGDGLIDCADPDCTLSQFSTTVSLPNGDFENNLTNWAQDVSPATTADAHAGAAALLLDAANEGIDQTIPITAGQPYQIELWAKKTGTNWTGFGIDWQDAGGSKLGSLNGAVQESAVYQKYAIVDVPPPGTVQGSVWIYTDGGVTAQLDDVVVSTTGTVENAPKGNGPNILLHNGFEEHDPSLTFSTNLEGNPTEALADGLTNKVTGWFPALPSNYAFYVNDTQHSVNNPEGDYFFYLTGSGFCLASESAAVIGTSTPMVDGKSYTISFQAASWVTSLNGSGLPDGGAASQAKGDVAIEFKTTATSTHVVSEWEIPASPSWANLNWQKLTYTFVYDGSDPLKEIVFTNGNNGGVAIDGIELREKDICPGSGLDPEVCYIISDGFGSGSSTPDTLYSINHVTGALTPIGPTGTYNIEAMAIDPVNDIIYAISADTLGTIDPSTGAFTAVAGEVGSLNGAEGMLSIYDVDGLTYDTLNQVLWGSGRRGSTSSNFLPDDQLLQIDPATGLGIPDAFGAGVGYFVIATAEHDIDDIALGADGTLYAISNQGSSGNQRLGTINKTTGAWTEIADHGIADVEGMTFTSAGQLIVTTGDDGPDRNRFYTVDPQTAESIFISDLAPANDVEACACRHSFFQNGLVGNFVWADMDNDGLQDLGEPGVEGVTVNLLDGSGSPIMKNGTAVTTVTDVLGHYQFNDLAKGQNYIVEFVLPAGASFTAQNMGGDDAIDSDPNMGNGRTAAFQLAYAGQFLKNIDAGMTGITGIPKRECADDGQLMVADIDGNILLFDQNTGALIDTFIKGLNTPKEMLVGDDDWLYVSDAVLGEIRKYSLITGAYVETLADGFDEPNGMVLGSDGFLYVNTRGSDEVWKINAITGDTSLFIAAGTGGLDSNRGGIAFGPDGNLYVASQYTHTILRYNGITGAFIDVFASGSGLSGPHDIQFGADGNLYVANRGNDNVLRFNGTTGAFVDIFVTTNSGGMNNLEYLDFGADGNLYVSSSTGAGEVYRYNGTTGAFMDIFTSGLIEPKGMLFAPVPNCGEICGNGIDDDGDGLVDCFDPDCHSIFITDLNISNCIDHPLMDVANLSVEVGWANAPANDTIEVSIYGKTEYIDVANGAISPQTLTFVVPADGTVANSVTASWRVNNSLCSESATYDAPMACSSDQINCDILYLCGNDKPYDGDAWDHGWIQYLDAVNGSASLTPVLTKDDGTGLGMYDPMNPSAPVSINFADYGLIIVSATTENHISTDLVNAIKDLPTSLINSNWLLGQALGMSNYGPGTAWGGSAFVDNATSKEFYNFNNDISPQNGKLFTTISPLANADTYLWANAGDQAANNNGIFVLYEDTDALPGIAAGHGRRVYFGYHMNGFYANAENGGALPAPVEGWLDPAKHLTLDGKFYLDQALLTASIACNSEICNNGLDDDGDGLIDCADDQCGVPAFSTVNAAAPNNCPLLDNGQITISPVAGVEYSIDGGANYQPSNLFTGLSAGSYNVRIRSLNSGCFTNYPSNPVNIFDPICNEVCDNGVDDDGDGLIDCDDPDCGPQVSLPNGLNSCVGASVSITATGSGGGAPYAYQWATLGTGDTHIVSPASTTTYFVTLTDANGCTAENQIEVAVTNCAETCGDGVDNDGDGLIDCDDPDCLAVGQPQPQPDNYTTCPVTELWEQVTFNDGNLQDPTYSIFQYPSIGSLNMQPNGVFQYTSFSNSCGQDRFIYQVCNQVTGCCDTASVYLQIGDSAPPVLQNIPADITISCDDAVPEIPVFVYGVDACPGIFISFNEESAEPNAGSCQSYEIRRTWTATDRCGNSASDTQVITVADTEAPELFRVYTLANGARVMAGVAKRATGQWKYVEFPVNFDTAPVVFSQVVTTGEATAVNVRQRHVSQEGFELKLQEEERQDGLHTDEEVAWLAIEGGTLDDASLLQVGLFENLNNTTAGLNFANAYPGTPSFVASVQTYADGDPTGVRYSNLSPSAVNVFLEEETTEDTEVVHGNEALGFLAMSPGELVDEDQALVGEASFTVLNENWKTVPLSQRYTKPVVIFGGLPSGGDPATVRVRNVTPNSFEVRIQEWENYDGVSGNKTVPYLIVEGSIPGMPAYYCDEDAASLQPGFNLFATDNCDAQVVFEYNETSEFTPAGLKVHRSWVIIDDCGNTNNLGRTDTCTMVALKLRTFLYGAMIGAAPDDNLMRDDLRKNGLVPLEEPYSALEAFQHVREGGGETTTQGMLSITGNNAVVDWVFVEIRDGANSGKIVSTCSALLQRDGDVVGADGNPILYFPGLNEGNYYVSIRHRNHLGLITGATEYLNVANEPTIDFGLMSTDVNGDFAAGKQISAGSRACWAGDLNNDGRVIFQGPDNDVFTLFSTVLSDGENYDYLANFIKAGYLSSDLNMDGKSIYQGPNNDRAMILYHSILLHPVNSSNLANFIVSGSLP